MALQIFSPDITIVESKEEFLQFKGKSASDLKKSVAAIPTSSAITGIEIRLLPPFVIDNRTPAVFPFPGFAKLYCLTIVVSDINNQLAGGIDLQGFPRIGDKEHIPINKTLFYWQASPKQMVPPSQIHVMTSVIKSKKSLRDVGAILADLSKDSAYKNLAKSLAKLSVQTNLALEVITQLSSIVGKYLGQVEDKPLGTIVNSFTSLYGDFDMKGVQKKNYTTRQVNFDLEIIVRDDAAAVRPDVGAASKSARKPITSTRADNKGTSPAKTASAKRTPNKKVKEVAETEEVNVELYPIK
jgi:hypothetical protein